MKTPSEMGGRQLGLGIAAALAVLAIVAALTEEPPPGAPAPPPLAKMLPERPPCGVARAAASARAHALEREGEARRARYPFAPEVGIAVWRSWSEAADCQRLAGDGPAALRAERLTSAWQHRLERDLRASHLRLERALASSEPATAARQAKQLLALLPATSGGYRRWLLQIRAAGPEAAP